jgi:hypothetical protein
MNMSENSVIAFIKQERKQQQNNKNEMMLRKKKVRFLFSNQQFEQFAE